MDVEKACQDIALVAARTYVQSNLAEYKCEDGVDMMISDLAKTYVDAYHKAKEQIKE